MKYERSETKPTVEFVDDEPVQNKETKNDLNMLEIAAFSVIGLIAIGGMIILVKRRKSNTIPFGGKVRKYFII